MRTITILSCLLLLMGCNARSSPRPDAEATDLVKDLTAEARGPSSGASTATSSANDLPIVAGAAWGASQFEGTSTSAETATTSTISGSGSLVTGFVMGITAEQQASANAVIKEAIEADPILKSIADEMTYLMDSEGYTPEWAVRMDKLRADYRTMRASLVDALKESGVVAGLDMASLETLVVNGTIIHTFGAEERVPTDEEVKNRARLIPNTVNAAKAQGQILGPDEKTEGGGE